MTPGPQEQYDWAAALDVATGTLRHGCEPRNTNELFQKLLQTLDDAYPAPQFQRVYVVVDNDKIHQAKAVEPWLAKHPRFTLRLLPPSGPRAHPIARAFGDV